MYDHRVSSHSNLNSFRSLKTKNKDFHISRIRNSKIYVTGVCDLNSIDGDKYHIYMAKVRIKIEYMVINVSIVSLKDTLEE